MFNWYWEASCLSTKTYPSSHSIHQVILSKQKCSLIKWQHTSSNGHLTKSLQVAFSFCFCLFTVNAYFEKSFQKSTDLHMNHCDTFWKECEYHLLRIKRKAMWKQHKLSFLFLSIFHYKKFQTQKSWKNFIVNTHILNNETQLPFCYLPFITYQYLFPSITPS